MATTTKRHPKAPKTAKRPAAVAPPPAPAPLVEADAGDGAGDGTRAMGHLTTFRLYADQLEALQDLAHDRKKKAGGKGRIDASAVLRDILDAKLPPPVLK